jgi:hypothetical protein
VDGTRHTPAPCCRVLSKLQCRVVRSSLSPAFNPWRMCCSIFPFSPPLFSSVESFRAPPCSAPFLPEPFCGGTTPPHSVVVVCLGKRPGEPSSPSCFRPPLPPLPCSVSSPLRRTPGQARVTTMPSHPRRPLVQIGDSENPFRRQIASRSAAATPSPVVASVFCRLELCLTTLDPFHQLQETADPCSHPRSCESCRR